MSNRMSALSLISSCILLALASGCATPDAAVDSDEEVDSAAQAIGPAEVNPATVAQAKGWLTWAFGQAWSTGPVLDTTGAACASGQSGSTWFLAGTTGGPVTRSCTIPANKTLVVPLINRWIVFRPEAYPDADAVAKAQNMADNYLKQQLARTCGLTLKVDGVEVAGTFDEMYENLYVEERTPFTVTLYPGDNFVTPFGVPSGINGGDMPAETAGHYAEIEPLSPGDHVIELGGKTCQNKNQVIFETSATYLLHVDN